MLRSLGRTLPKGAPKMLRGKEKRPRGYTSKKDLAE